MPPAGMPPAWQTYADELVMLGHGIALWQPAPLHNYNKVNIGDVGYIQEGRFHLLFSAALPLGDRQLGVDVPHNFVPLIPGPTVKDQPRVPGALHTEYIEQRGAALSASVDITGIDIGTTLQFGSSSKKGAILLTKYKTYREDAERRGLFKEYMLRYYRSWFDFAKRTGHDVNLEDIRLITGHDMTLDFAMLAFSSNYRQIDIEFEVGLPAVASSAASVWGSWRLRAPVHHNCGPQHTEPPTNRAHLLPSQDSPSQENVSSEYNQCVFLRGFRIHKRVGIIPTVIRAAAGPHDLGSGKRDSEEGPLLHRKFGIDEDPESENEDMDMEDEDEDEDITFEVASDSPSFVDPMEWIFRYIFEHSIADIAIVHDSDLSNLLKVTGTSAAEDMHILVSRLLPSMVEEALDGTACIKSLDRMLESYPMPGIQIPLREKRQSNLGHLLPLFHDIAQGNPLPLSYAQKIPSSSSSLSSSASFSFARSSSSSLSSSPSSFGFASSLSSTSSSFSGLGGSGAHEFRSRLAKAKDLVGLPQLPRDSSTQDAVGTAASPTHERPPPTLANLDEGVPVHTLSPSCLFIVEFKAGRTALFYATEDLHGICAGDLVIVEADRGKDLGKVVDDKLTLAKIEAFQEEQAQNAIHMVSLFDSPPVKRDIVPRQIYAKAQSGDVQLLIAKVQDESKALQVCQNKVRMKKIPMEVVDAEYQWDRRKLTFYFTAEKRIDFRELVRELFRSYKTRIQMMRLITPQE